jgi:hypothetical protein
MKTQASRLSQRIRSLLALTILATAVCAGAQTGAVPPVNSLAAPAANDTIVLLDLSGSMAEPLDARTKIEAVCSEIGALGRRLEQEREGPSIMLLGFTVSLETSVKLVPGPGAAAAAQAFCQRAVETVARGKRTALYNALNQALEATVGPVALHVVSDGLDNASGPGALENFLRRASGRGVRIGLLGLGKGSLSSLESEFNRVPPSLRGGVVGVSEVTDLSDNILPPRIVVVHSDHDTNVIAIGGPSRVAGRHWSVDGRTATEGGEHLVITPRLTSGRHEVTLTVTRTGGGSYTVAKMFEVAPPPAPPLAIIGRVATGSYVAGKRYEFTVEGAETANVEWIAGAGTQLVESRGGRATYKLTAGRNRIAAQVRFSNGAIASPNLLIEAKEPAEKLQLSVSSPILIGKSCTVTATLGGKPVTVEFRLGDVRVVGAAFTFQPSGPSRVHAVHDDDGLLYRSELDLNPAYPEFQLELTGPDAVDHGQTFVVAAVISGDDKPVEIRWAYGDDQRAHGPSATLRASNETGAVRLEEVSVTATTATGRTFSKSRQITVHPRPPAPVPGLAWPTIIRVGEPAAIVDQSKGLVESRLLTIGEAPARPLAGVAEITFERPGPHALSLEVSGPGGTSIRQYQLQVEPALVAPSVTLALPAAVYRGQSVELTVDVRGDYRNVTWRAAGLVLGQGQPVVRWTPKSTGEVVVECQVEPAHPDHRPARQAATIRVRPAFLKVPYEHPRATAGALLALLAFGLVTMASRRAPRLYGSLKVEGTSTDGNSFTTQLGLSGKSLDLRAALLGKGVDAGDLKAVARIVHGRVCLVVDGEIQPIELGYRKAVTPSLAATWISESGV